MGKESILVPSTFSEVKLPRDIEGRKKEISSREGDLVLIVDEHLGEHMPRLGFVKVDPKDNDRYIFQVPSIGREGNKLTERRLFYNDLNALYQGAGTYFSADFEKSK